MIFARSICHCANHQRRWHLLQVKWRRERAFVVLPLFVLQHEIGHLAGCRMCSRPCSFGHGSPRKDPFDQRLSVNVEPDTSENKHAGLIGRLSVAGSHDTNFLSEDLPSPLKVIVHGCSSNGSLHCSDAEHFVNVSGSALLSSAGVKHRELQNGVDELQNGVDELHVGNSSFFNTDVADSRSGRRATNCCKREATPFNLESKVIRPVKRAFCERCEKAQDLCICGRFKSVVRNKVKITILQNPKEKQHAVGSVRVALLGLENVVLVDVPELYTKESFRIRPKVPGSKRSLAGRGGKKLLLNGGKVPAVQDKASSEVEALQTRNLLIDIFKCDINQDRVWGQSRWSAYCSEDGVCENVDHNEHLNEASNNTGKGCLCIQELGFLIPPGVALLYPSDKAVELSKVLNNDHKETPDAPQHLLVLDGTWSKARRIYFENPWLHSLPHYKLSLSSPSLYEGVRKQPKAGCLSSLESIVYALKVLEPENEEGLDGLLEVFDSMVEDQRRCKQMKCCVQDSDL